MIFIINTATQGATSVALIKGDSFYKKTVAGKESGKILVLLDNLLKKVKAKKEDLTGVVVVSGPGPFTSVRQGVVVANALARLLNIPIIGVRAEEFNLDKKSVADYEAKLKKVKAGKIVLPFYDREPNITKPKVSI
ncbi:hypothetical protein A2316_04155 [Candidatus Falkowbacteria bacterium RIFOXYB2_FULL_38_15]|uniref:Gcp-like domain-containing protein n=1 Tax=Candidatus Falkowbacteria bacterium RIFOXYA2_FULL_38_12 TaxID=1797993 RepID=A0A1F5S254_9BACT|nr:MAG: hypothetical protein A2257_03300 [Candidatus Falkowbacteria bacterium RIFOXYA2_FULL_38_12]OGF33679.1 MAG: hypothetical protein A2316_04155 [Candidatus Falkowbacteria bacterium RIFOXYB2_FULL_38_15]OGF42040.1 MAG: hypothetical protein A2555_01415 [Candidatus Falkowbacteria bacterium RIFOXYD2_FULL_39_16]